MQVSNLIMTSPRNNSHLKNKQVEVSTNELNKNVEVSAQTILDPMRLITSEKAIQDRLDKFSADKKLTVELLTPKKNKVNYKKSKSNQNQQISSKRQNEIVLNSQLKNLKQKSEVCEKLNDKEQALVRNVVEIAECKQISSSKSFCYNKENLEDLDFAVICTMFDETSIKEEKKLKVIENISEGALSKISKPIQKNKVTIKATNDSFITMALSKSVKIYPVDYDFMKKIRFSQRTVNNIMTSNETLFAFQERLRIEGFKKEGAIIIVLMPDGTFTSYDNRRLLCALIVAEKCRDFKIFVEEKSHEDIPDSKMLDYNRYVFTQEWHYVFHLADNVKQKNGNSKWGICNGVSAGTWGELVQLRIVLFAITIFNAMRNGYNVRPEVR